MYGDGTVDYFAVEIVIHRFKFGFIYYFDMKIGKYFYNKERSSWNLSTLINPVRIHELAFYNILSFNESLHELVYTIWVLSEHSLDKRNVCILSRLLHQANSNKPYLYLCLYVGNGRGRIFVCFSLDNG